MPAGTNVAFEDIAGGGDLNYWDHSFVYQIVAIPEPAHWAMLLAGACGLVLLKWRR